MEAEPSITGADTVDSQPAGLGASLRATRMRLGISLEQAAKALHLPKKIVIALEDEDHEILPAPAYVKGYLRVYARVLEIDEQRLIEQYLALNVRDPELNVSGPVKEGTPNRLAVGLSAAAVALVSVVLSTLWWNTQQRELAQEVGIDRPALAERGARTLTDADTGERFAPLPRRQATRGSARESAARQRVANKVAKENVTAQSAAVQGNRLSRERDGTRNIERTNGRDAPLTSRELYAANLESLAVRRGASPGVLDTARRDDPAAPNAAPASGAAANLRSPAPDTTDNNPSPADATGTDTLATDTPDKLALRYRDDSWTEVKDASGRQLLYGMVAAGEARRVAGEAPFEVLLGRSRSVRLTINGEAFDPSPYIRANDTARFTVDTTSGQ